MEFQDWIVRQIRSLFPEVKIKVFGSRVQDTNKRYSDLDICLDGGSRLDEKKMMGLEARFSDSDIPYRIDLSDYHLLDEGFQRVVDESCLEW